MATYMLNARTVRRKITNDARGPRVVRALKCTTTHRPVVEIHASSSIQHTLLLIAQIIDVHLIALKAQIA